jgi:hypothetical protein
LNWTEILRSAGVPDAPGYQELQALMREEREAALRDGVDTVQHLTGRKRSRRKSGSTRKRT